VLLLTGLMLLLVAVMKAVLRLCVVSAIVQKSDERLVHAVRCFGSVDGARWRVQRHLRRIMLVARDRGVIRQR
jgi:hypothetical protein